VLKSFDKGFVINQRVN